MSDEYIGILTTLTKTKKQTVPLKEKLVSFPLEVFDELEKDATRCRRNVNKHIEAILVAYLDIEDVELQNVIKVRTQFNRVNTDNVKPAEEEKIAARQLKEVGKK